MKTKRWSAMKEAKNITFCLITGYLMGDDTDETYNKKRAEKVLSALEKLAQRLFENSTPL